MMSGGYTSLNGNDGDDYHYHESTQSGTSGEDWKVRVSTMGEKVKTSSVEIGKKVGENLSAVGGKLSEQVTVVSERMKEMFYTPSFGEKLVEDATAPMLIGPDWERNLQICDLVNMGKVPGADVAKGVKRRLALRNNAHVQLLTLTLLEMAVKNCERMFSDVASEKVLEEMVKIVDGEETPPPLKDKALQLIEAWGEATEELRFLPVFEETYKSLLSRGVVFPPRDNESLAPIFTPPQSAPITQRSIPEYAGRITGTGISEVSTAQGPVVVMDSKEIFNIARNSVELLTTVLTSAPAQEVLQDELTGTLVGQCKASKLSVQRLVENAGDNDSVLFEALSVNDELDKALAKFEEIKKENKAPGAVQANDLATRAAEEDERADVSESLVRARPEVGEKPNAATGQGDEKELAELDEMIFGKKKEGGDGTSGGPSGATSGGKKDADDLIVF